MPPTPTVPGPGFFAQARLKARDYNGVQQIGHVLRHQWLVLTPEEWVRQGLLYYLHQQLQYPAGLISTERKISRQNNHAANTRFDILVHHPESGKPLLLAECKAPSVALHPNPEQCPACQQAIRYNKILQAPYVLVTNSQVFHCLSVGGRVSENSLYQPLPAIPAWEELCSSTALDL